MKWFDTPASQLTHMQVRLVAQSMVESCQKFKPVRFVLSVRRGMVRKRPESQATEDDLRTSLHIGTYDHNATAEQIAEDIRWHLLNECKTTRLSHRKGCGTCSTTGQSGSTSQTSTSASHREASA